MGSGISNNYSNFGNTLSQEYSLLYSVVPEMYALDRKRGILLNDGSYDVNPTRSYLEDVLVDGKVRGRDFTGILIYVIDKDGRIVVGDRNGNGPHGKQTPHPCLVGGKDPQVSAAGLIYIKNGDITRITRESGHYRPNKKSMPKAKAAFAKIMKGKQNNET